MIKLKLYKVKGVQVQATVSENPTPGSFGDYLLLKNELKKKDEWVNDETDTKANRRFKQLKINTEFLLKKLEKHGELHCEYCGLSPLTIHYWREHYNGFDLATVDHFFPASKFTELKEDETNLIVSCKKCNNKKADKEWPLSSLKHKYKND